MILQYWHFFSRNSDKWPASTWALLETVTWLKVLESSLQTQLQVLFSLLPTINLHLELQRIIMIILFWGEQPKQPWREKSGQNNNVMGLLVMRK